MAVRIPVNETSGKRQRKTLSREQKYTYSVRLIYGALILLAGLLQNTPHLFPTIFGVHAWLLLPLMVCIAMLEKSLTGTLFGILAGALWDVALARGDGFHALFFMLASSGVCILMNYLMRNNLVTALILSSGTIVLYGLVHWLIFFVLSGADGVWLQLARFYLPSMVYSFLFTPIFYMLLRSILKKLRLRFPRSTTISRP